ncbi:DNA-formamidopyrimidine glycosylase [Vagococcus sp. CY52-2]|uniref:DNA-formamidopyrimidine glycosylase n=1 Tax=Vagococcus sp. CY52-2 TaxID=2925838 RepID=UPI001F56043F|nr:DNA-formamidopyrimidine glycosylase [Vagococcus sp. CY52-2]UNM90417.1 DNA-formamidopyrimidine glycosylase [Vagococcus sp. CY52-2]
MPELPEVETVRKGLVQLVKGKEISNVIVDWGRIIESPEVDEFIHTLVGQTILDVDRRGKFLIFKLSHHDMISHLRMEGKFEYHSQTDEIQKHTHVRFQFTDGTELRYLDVRKFGRLSLEEKDHGEDYKGIKKLGPEPILPDFDLEVFKQQLKKKHRAIKPLLLDQTLVTGLGNIYVDEALYQSCIHPEQIASKLTDNEVETLHQSIIDVLAIAVEAGGTTIRTYKNALGDAGNFQVYLSAYGKQGEPCKRCGHTIEKIKVAQRGTHFCPVCQVAHD